MKDIPITEARHELTSLPERLVEEPGAVAVTRRGKPVLAILPWDLYESILETLEILGDKEQMAALRKGIEEITKGKGIPWEKARRPLGL
jgi:antitoxin YefM